MLLETKAIKLTTGDTPNNGFYSGTVELGSFSEPFESIPKVIATMASANGTTLLIGIVSTSKTSWGRAVIVSNAKRTDFPCSIFRYNVLHYIFINTILNECPNNILLRGVTSMPSILNVVVIANSLP